MLFIFGVLGVLEVMGAVSFGRLPGGFPIRPSLSVLSITPLALLMGLVGTCCVAAVVLPAVALTLAVGNERPGRDQIGRVAGSLVAYASLQLFGFLALSENVAPNLFGVVLFALGMWTGQVAGCLAGGADFHRRQLGRLPTAPFRLTLWRLMALMLPISAVLTFLQVADLFSRSLLLSSAAASVVTVATWRPTTWLVSRQIRRHR
ncbi:hypothetical protein [Botrimarina colliarenosi]|uniref:hypothetical protein n=1 Tax=Botrimarina colliarenosi TaxID=2528001 RepID=UPI0018D487AA|nr:hypothetical protein [Botrimarina colliarenosi]